MLWIRESGRRKALAPLIPAADNLEDNDIVSDMEGDIEIREDKADRMGIDPYAVLNHIFAPFNAMDEDEISER